jgi:hypothetical protein
MARFFTFDERPDSREFNLADKKYTLRYKAVGNDDDLFVQAYALSATPLVASTSIGTLRRSNVQVAPDGYAQYLVTVDYGTNQTENGSYTFDFDTTGATVKIKAAKEHVESYPTSGDPYKAAINVDQDGKVQGADIVIPMLKLSVKFQHPQGVVDIPFARMLARATGHTNSLAFLSHDPGELLYLGSSGSDGSQADAEVAYHFASSENVTDLSFGDITGIVKEGHHLAWVEFKDEVDSGNPVQQPKSVHIERVYDAISFADVFGWG